MLAALTVEFFWEKTIDNCHNLLKKQRNVMPVYDNERTEWLKR